MPEVWRRKEFTNLAHRPPEGRAGHRAGGGGEKLTQRDSFVYLEEAVCEDGDRCTSKSTGRSELVESSWWGDGRPADLKKTEEQGHEHLCHTVMPVRNRNLGSDRTTTTKAASVRKQLGAKTTGYEK